MKNPLFLPLVMVSVVAGVEAVALLMVLSRDRGPQAALQNPAAGHAPSDVAATGLAPPAAPAPTPAPVPPPATISSAEDQGVARGKKGQRVESAGFAITVEEITDEPTYKDMARVGPEQRYLALLLRVENNTGGNAGLFPAQFLLQDEKGFEYQRLSLPVKQPLLEWRTMGNRESIRGYIDFVVPKSAKGLKLIYAHLPAKGSEPIHIELGE